MTALRNLFASSLLRFFALTPSPYLGTLEVRDKKNELITTGGSLICLIDALFLNDDLIVVDELGVYTIDHSTLTIAEDTYPDCIGRAWIENGQLQVRMYFEDQRHLGVEERGSQRTKFPGTCSSFAFSLPLVGLGGGRDAQRPGVRDGGSEVGRPARLECVGGWLSRPT